MNDVKLAQKQSFNRAQIELEELRAKQATLEKRPKWIFWFSLQSKAEALVKLRSAKKMLEMKVDELRTKYFLS